MAALSFIVRLDQRQRTFLMEYSTHKELTWKDIKVIVEHDVPPIYPYDLLQNVELAWHPSCQAGDTASAETANNERRQYNARNGYVSFTLMRAVVNLRPEQIAAYVMGNGVDAGGYTPCLDNYSQPAPSELNAELVQYFNSIDYLPAWCYPEAADREIKRGDKDFCNRLLNGKSGNSDAHDNSQQRNPTTTATTTATTTPSSSHSKRRTLGAKPRAGFLPHTPREYQKKLPPKRKISLTSESDPESTDTRKADTGKNMQFKTPRSASDHACSGQRTFLRGGKNAERHNITPKRLEPSLVELDAALPPDRQSQIQSILSWSPRTNGPLDLSGIVLSAGEVLELSTNVCKDRRVPSVHLKASGQF
jgi:hypothetical protein